MIKISTEIIRSNYYLPPTTPSPAIIRSSSSESKDYSPETFRNFWLQQNQRLGVFKFQVSKLEFLNKDIFLNLKLEKTSNKAPCFRIPAISPLFTYDFYLNLCCCHDLFLLHRIMNPGFIFIFVLCPDLYGRQSAWKSKKKKILTWIHSPEVKTKAPAKTQTLIFLRKDTLFVCSVGVIVPERSDG